MHNKNVLFIVSIFINVVLLVVIWAFNADVSDHNNQRTISTLNAMESFAAEAEKYLDAGSFNERKKIGALLDKEYWKIIEARRGVTRVNIPFLGGDETLYRTTGDLITYVFNPLWSLTYLSTEERAGEFSIDINRDSIIKRGKELNKDEINFFSEILMEYKGFKESIEYNKDGYLSRNTRNEIINQGRRLIDRSQELEELFLNNYTI